MLISSYILVFILGLVVDSLVSKYFYDKIRQLERDGKDAICNVQMEESRMRMADMQRFHEDKIKHIEAMYQENAAKLRARYGG